MNAPTIFRCYLLFICVVGRLDGLRCHGVSHPHTYGFHLLGYHELISRFSPGKLHNGTRILHVMPVYHISTVRSVINILASKLTDYSHTLWIVKLVYFHARNKCIDIPIKSISTAEDIGCILAYANIGHREQNVFSASPINQNGARKSCWAMISRRSGFKVGPQRKTIMLR